MNLDIDLKRALKRESPAPGFAGRVLARIEAEDGQSWPSGAAESPVLRRKRPVWWRAAAASVAFATIVGGYTTWRVVEHRRGERAKEQVLLAMKIASEKVSYAQREVRQIGSHD
jgi:hypothetical protein